MRVMEGQEAVQPQKKPAPRWVKIVIALVASSAVLLGSYFFWTYWADRPQRETTPNPPEDNGPISTTLRSLALARNASRQSDINTILNAVLMYTTDHMASLPPGLARGMPETQIGTATSGCTTSYAGACGTADSCVDLSSSLEHKYLMSIPIDPQETALEKTGYSIKVEADGTIAIKSCNAELGKEIVVSR